MVGGGRPLLCEIFHIKDLLPAKTSTFNRYSLVTLQKQVAQLSQRDRAAGWAELWPKWKTVTGKQYFTDIIGLSSTTVT